MSSDSVTDAESSSAAIMGHVFAHTDRNSTKFVKIKQLQSKPIKLRYDGKSSPKSRERKKKDNGYPLTKGIDPKMWAHDDESKDSKNYRPSNPTQKGLPAGGNSSFYGVVPIVDLHEDRNKRIGGGRTIQIHGQNNVQ